MTKKCIGIISYFPKNLEHRKARKERFQKLIKVLNAYFKLPIVIIAQNWQNDDIQITYNNKIIIYNYNDGLGITRARIILREKLLNLDYDYYIFLDDDSDIQCTENGVRQYLNEIDSHPNMVGKYFSSWPRLLAISKYMLNIMDYEYIKKYDATRGEIWEDMAYMKTYEKLYPNKFFNFSKKEISEVSPVSRGDKYSTWYKKEYGNEVAISRKTRQIIDNWYKSKRSK